MMKQLTSVTILLGLFLQANILFAQVQKGRKDGPTTRILFVFDCSLSMSKRWEGSTNMDISKRILTQTIDSLSRLDKVEVALRMYGHQSSVQPNRNCKDTKLEVPFFKGNIAALKEKVKSAQPRGTTPIAYTLEQCGNDFPNDPNARNIIILITDGIEECDGDPCAVSAALQSRNIILRPFVIGVGLDENFKKTFDCVGKFFDAKNEKSFQYAMGVIISQALNSTSAQVNLLDSYSKPTETAVDMSFYDMRTGNIKYNYVHTINNRGNPDTIPLDPLSTYKIVVHTIPPVEKDSVELTPGKHTIIGIDAPQGYLAVKANGTNEYKELKYIIRRKGEMQTLLVSDAERTEKLIVGKYDVEVLSMPRIYLNDIVVSQSKTTTVQIPQPGIANIVMQNLGYGQLFLNEKNSLKLLYNLNENNYKETLVLQPGNYTIVFRPKNAKESIYTITREFKIDSGGSVQVKLF
jgi:Ca-activated chloride channel family protein